MSDKVKLTSSDDSEFEVDRKVAEMSGTLQHMLADVEESDEAIPLPNVTGEILKKVIQYCEYHLEHPSNDTGDARDEKSLEFDPWDAEFVNVEQGTLFELILAANFLDIKPLLDVTCKKVASMIKGKSPEEIRKTFNIKNDFTPEEEEQVRKENEWCEER